MIDEVELDASERHWLLALDRGPLTKATADDSVPATTRDSLIEKKLAQWKYGVLEVVLLELTARGAMEARRLRMVVA